MMVLWMDGREQKVGFAEKNCGYSSYRGDRGYREEMALRVCGEGRGCLWYAISRWRFVFDYLGVAKWWWMVDFLEEC